MLATNERDHAWMDEGINLYHERRYSRLFYPDVFDRELPPFFRKYSRMGMALATYLAFARIDRDEVSDQPVENQHVAAYWIGAYVKPPLALEQLEAYVGQSRLDAAIQAYFRQWQGKHPRPEDFRQVLEQALGQSLG